MMNDNDIASKFNATIHILFVFGWIIVLIIRKGPLFGTNLKKILNFWLHDMWLYGLSSGMWLFYISKSLYLVFYNYLHISDFIVNN